MSERFKTNYKNEIPNDGVRLYDIVDKNGNKIESNVKLVRSNGNKQEGDEFGATEVNAIHSRLNELADVDKVEQGSFGAQIDGIFFPIHYTKAGKLVVFVIDVTLSQIKNVQYELTIALPFAVYDASGVCNLHVSANIVGYGRFITNNKRLIFTCNNAYGAPVTIQGSVMSVIK